MFDYNYLKNIFIDNGGILKTSQLNGYGFSAYIINQLLLDDKLTRVSRGHYMLSDTYLHDYEIISSLFPEAIVYLESALLLHEYTDRIPNEWQIAIGRNKDRNKYNLDYPKIKAYFIEENILEIGVMEIETYLNDMDKNTRIITKIYDKDKTICDIIRHRNKIDKEVFNNGIFKPNPILILMTSQDLELSHHLRSDLKLWYSKEKQKCGHKKAPERPNQYN